MSTKKRFVDEIELDENDLSGDDFDIDVFLRAQERPNRRRGRAYRRYEQARDRRKLREDLEDWNDRF